MHHPAIRTHDPVLRKKIIDLGRLHLGHDLVAVIGTRSLDRIQIKSGRRVIGCMHH